MLRLRHKKNKRPIAVTVIAWAIFILFLVRLYQAVDPLLEIGLLHQWQVDALFADGRLTHVGNLLLTGVTYTFLSLSGIVVLIGFLRMNRWSWVVLMVWTAVSLAITLLDYVYQEPNYIVMASDAIIAFALNQADVQRIFGIRVDTNDLIR